MDYNKFIQAREISIGSRTFTVSKIPAIEAQTQSYPAVAKAISTDGILGLTMLKPSAVLDILKYSAVRLESGSWMELDSIDRINKTFTEVKEMHKLVVEMVKENFGFLIDGSLREVLGVPEAEVESDS